MTAAGSYVCGHGGLYEVLFGQFTPAGLRAVWQLLLLNIPQVHIVAKTVKPRTLTVYSKFGFVFREKLFLKAVRRVCGCLFFGACLLLLWEHISGRLYVKL